MPRVYAKNLAIFRCKYIFILLAAVYLNGRARFCSYSLVVVIEVEIYIIIPIDNILKNELNCCQIVPLLRGLIRFNVFRHNKNVLA